MKLAFVVLAKLAVSAALIVLVLRAFDVRGVMDPIAKLDAASAMLALGIALAAVPVQAIRWRVVLAEYGTRLPFANILGIVLIGHFFNQTLPSSVGGDAMRMWCAYRAGMTPAGAAATVILDRAASLLGLLLLMACGLPWLLERVPYPAARSAIVVLLAAGIGGFLVVPALASVFRQLPQSRVTRPLSVMFTLARRVLTSPRCLVAIFALGVAGGAIFSGIVFVLGRALGADLGLVDCLLLVPPVLLVSAVPISVAGWGLREGAMVVALGFVGVAPETAFAVSVLLGLVVAAASLPGVAIWLAGGYASGSLGQVVDFEKEATAKAAFSAGDSFPGHGYGDR